ncbi:MAG: hypothetical protein ACD_51C00183G0005 [uncultured bacterium]|nr:MAG: hypothetical protein ACD_51C00183G0005 [uncultured bacterium]
MPEVLHSSHRLSLVDAECHLASSIKEKDLIFKEKEIHKSQVKVWQHHANGIEMGLFLASNGKFSGVDDMKETIKAIQPEAASLAKSLNEERLFTDEEIKDRQIKQENEQKERLQGLAKKTN